MCILDIEYNRKQKTKNLLKIKTILNGVVFVFILQLELKILDCIQFANVHLIIIIYYYL